MSSTLSGTLGAPAGRVARPRMTMFVPAARARRIATIAAFIGFVLLPTYVDLSPWIGVGIALTVFVGWHALEASRTVPWIPGLSMLAACIQWILAPWVAYVLQPLSPYISMLVPSVEYFQFAVPASLALVSGVFIALRKQGRQSVKWPEVAATPAFRRTCIAMVIFGVAARLVLTPLAPASFRFAMYLMSSLSLVGVLGLMLSNSLGWQVGAIVLVLIEGFYNTLDAQYLDVMLLIGFIAITYVFRFKVRKRTMVGWLAVAALGLLAINAMKAVYRHVLYTQQVAFEERLGTAGEVASDLAASPSAILSDDNLLYNLSRLNQGGVITRVMAFVPSREPYARGETILTAFRAALLPRVLDPNKPKAGGVENYRRFTGYQLIGGTSVNLAIPGEMYANFGRWGIAAVLVYGLALGWVFGLLVRWSRRSPLWWAWAPFVLYSTVSAEMGTNEIFNQVSKSLFVVAVIAFVVPAWSAIRRSPALRSPARGGPIQSAAMLAQQEGR